MRRRMKRADLAWVAGLLEGEGCFTWKSKNRAQRSGLAVTCHMTDADVLRRLHRIVGGTFHGPYTNGPRGRLPRFFWRIGGLAARQLMELLLPWMGKRRAARIEELIHAYDAIPLRVYRVQHVASGRIVETRNWGAWLIRHGVSESGMHRTLTGHRAQCRGWRRLK